MAFQKGQSGNPQGRPKKGRALTDTLASVCGGGSKKAIAEKVREAILTGKVTFPPAASEPGEGIPECDLRPRIVWLSVDEWTAILKWLYAQVDGPPPTKTTTEITGKDGGPVETVAMTYDQAVAKLAEQADIPEGLDDDGPDSDRIGAEGG